MTDTPPTMTTPTAAPGGGVLSPVTPDPIGTPDMSYVDYARKCFQPYVNFDGRARRKEYGSFMAAYFITIFALFILQMIIVGATNGNGVGGALGGLISLLIFLVWAGTVVPAVGLTVRRVHDIGLPFWAAIIAIVFNWVGFLVLLIVPSQDGANVYGPYPKPRV